MSYSESSAYFPNQIEETPLTENIVDIAAKELLPITANEVSMEFVMFKSGGELQREENCKNLLGRFSIRRLRKNYYY